MTRFKLIGAALALSAFVATPALAQVSEPAAAEARDPNFSIYSNYGPGPSRVMELARAVRGRGGTAYAGAAASRKPRRRQALEHDV